MRVLGIHPSHDASIAIVNDGRLEYFCKEERVSRIKHDELHWCGRNSSNGHTWGMEDMRVLGISPAHDASVAIIGDGKLEYFCKEERLSRVKHDRHHSPLSSQEHFLPWSFVKIIDDIGSIDHVVISSPTWYIEINDSIIELTKENSLLEIFLEKTFGAHGAKVVRRDKFHHEAHASLAFNNSGFESALIAVIDRQGSDVNGNMREAETIFKADLDYNFEPIYKSYWAYNIGEKFDLNIYNDIETLKKHWPDCEIVCESTLGITKVYETATTLIGQHSLENGKVMGLAAYGADQEFKDLFANGIPNTNLVMHLGGDDNVPILKEYMPHRIAERAPLPKEGYELYADYSYQVQKQTQDEVLKLIKEKVEETGITNVCVTGGYGLNVVANEHLVKNLPNVNFYFEPLADDSGNSIGAALQVYRQETKDKNIYPLKHTFFNHIKHPIDVDGIKTTVENIAKLLDQQKIVAIYNGVAEGGPRALGNRSILIDARNPDAKDIINGVKNREWYRPFAGSVLKEAAKDYFEMHNLDESPFMTVSFQVKDDKKLIIPGVIHVDGSCRIQTVDRDIPHFYELLKEFEKITGVPVLLNTSFNVAGEPLIESVEEAIETFENTKIDVLWFPEKEIMLCKNGIKNGQ